VRLLTYRSEDGLRLAVRTADGIVDAGPAGRLQEWLERPGTPSGPRLQESELRLGPCVPAPGKIICIGLNYRAHAVESKMDIPTSPVVFSKFNNTLAASGQPVALTSAAEQYDYEAELAAVIGRRCRSVGESEALDHVLGYCNANDLSARDLQFRTSQWLLGKSPDGFLPVGPELVTADEAGDPQALGVRCLVNGEVRQDSNTGDMIFSVAELVSYLSRHMTLEPGDLLVTGTPQGVIMGMEQKNWLRPGDEVVVEVQGLGRLTTPLVAG